METNVQSFVNIKSSDFY